MLSIFATVLCNLRNSTMNDRDFSLYGNCQLSLRPQLADQSVSSSAAGVSSPVEDAARGAPVQSPNQQFSTLRPPRPPPSPSSASLISGSWLASSKDRDVSSSKTSKAAQNEQNTVVKETGSYNATHHSGGKHHGHKPALEEGEMGDSKTSQGQGEGDRYQNQRIKGRPTPSTSPDSKTKSDLGSGTGQQPSRSRGRIRYRYTTQSPTSQPSRDQKPPMSDEPSRVSDR
jgi:hypothetical protein